MVYRETIIIAIFYMLDIVVLTIEIVSTIDIVLTVEIVSIKDLFTTFKNIVIVLIMKFVFAKVLFIVNILFVVFVSVIERN